DDNNNNNKETRKTVAVKQINPDKYDWERWKELPREAFVHSMLQHKNIVQLYGVCLEKKPILMLVLEMFPGKTLFEELSDPLHLNRCFDRFFGYLDFVLREILRGKEDRALELPNFFN